MIPVEVLRSRNSTFEFGTVVGIDMHREEYDDGTSSQYPSGLLMIRLMSSDVQIKAPYMMPSAGKSQFVGSLPELGSIAILANTGTVESATYIVLGFMPVPICKMVAVRKELSRMTAGEVLIQASANGGDDFWRAASTKWDEYGRFIITSGDEDLQIVVGDALSNEYTPKVAVVKDAITGGTVIYKMKMKDSSTTITRDGSLVEQWNRILQQVAGDWLSVLKGKFVVSSGDQIKLAARGENANFLLITGTGISMESIGTLIVKTGGKVDIEASDSIILSSLLDMAYMAGGNLQLKAAKDLLLTCSGSIKGSAPGDTKDPASGEISLTAGRNATLAGTQNASLLAIAGTVYLKSALANQSVIKGETFLNWLEAQTSLLDSLGMPVTKVGLTPTTTFLSQQVKVP